MTINWRDAKGARTGDGEIKGVVDALVRTMRENPEQKIATHAFGDAIVSVERGLHDTLVVHVGTSRRVGEVPPSTNAERSPTRRIACSDGLWIEHFPKNDCLPAVVRLPTGGSNYVWSGAYVSQGFDTKGDGYVEIRADAFERIVVAAAQQWFRDKLPQFTNEGIRKVAAERFRHLTEKGYDAGHDSQHGAGELVYAALWFAWAGLHHTHVTPGAKLLAVNATEHGMRGRDVWPDGWDRIQVEAGSDDALVKAAALLAAELDRRTEARTRG